MRRATVVSVALSALVVAWPSPAPAEIYRYVDEQGHSYYVDGLHNVPEQFRSSATPVNLPSVPASSTPAAPALKPGSAVIKYTPGQRILVEVKINGGATTQLILDTGADRTLISPRTLTAAGVSVTRPIATGQITGATGTDRIDYVLVESLAVGDARVGRMAVGAYELAGSGSEGLLGRDFLDQFKVTMDARAGEVHLTPK